MIRTRKNLFLIILWLVVLVTGLQAQNVHIRLKKSIIKGEKGNFVSYGAGLGTPYFFDSNNIIFSKKIKESESEIKIDVMVYNIENDNISYLHSFNSDYISNYRINGKIVFLDYSSGKVFLCVQNEGELTLSPVEDPIFKLTDDLFFRIEKQGHTILTKNGIDIFNFSPQETRIYKAPILSEDGKMIYFMTCNPNDFDIKGCVLNIYNIKTKEHTILQNPNQKNTLGLSIYDFALMNRETLICSNLDNQLILEAIPGFNKALKYVVTYFGVMQGTTSFFRSFDIYDNHLVAYGQFSKSILQPQGKTKLAPRFGPLLLFEFDISKK